MADAYSLDSLYELAKKALWATWMEMAPRYLEPVYALSGAATEEEYYSERVVVRPEAIPNPDYNGAPWVAPYSGYRYIRVTPEVLKDSRSPNLANEINSRLLSNLDREFWYGVIDTCNPDDHPSIVRGGLWE